MNGMTGEHEKLNWALIDGLTWLLLLNIYWAPFWISNLPNTKGRAARFSECHIWEPTIAMTNNPFMRFWNNATPIIWNRELKYSAEHGPHFQVILVLTPRIGRGQLTILAVCGETPKRRGGRKLGFFWRIFRVVSDFDEDNFLVSVTQTKILILFLLANKDTLHRQLFSFFSTGIWRAHFHIFFNNPIPILLKKYVSLHIFFWFLHQFSHDFLVIFLRVIYQQVSVGWGHNSIQNVKIKIFWNRKIGFWNYLIHHLICSTKKRKF